MNGYSDYELATRKHIRKLIEAGDYDAARATTRAFMKHKTRRQRRQALMQTVRMWVSVMNGDPNFTPGKPSQKMLDEAKTVADS